MATATQSIVVIDYNGGNLASAARAVARAAADSGIDATVTITADPESVRGADRIVLPGQGAFADCAAGLAAVPGLKPAIIDATEAGTPFLGICVGMQLMAQRGLEHAVTPGFGWISGEIARMEAPGLRLPQMGWNRLDFTPGAHPLTEGLDADAHGYFVHSYALRHGAVDELVATTDYGGAVPAIVARGNRAGTQFHVEKSQTVGLRILSNFLRWSPVREGAAA
ncbi:imidazole glycerol phosphate synthase subunit HisH [Gluconacetobacter diazotrophicus]|uniref:Imidazole glycerol phosphate synthase subunit HisH n=2 Tax=Gluconacetobacter diazotrophicus TaxID=33996 RepID=A9GZX5_GLUDA|nr:imidazole glycerol phosphate synthase subunit HisH [Gluconacetobacter diazotrophicus]MBB2157291.1 imidazole glycerol phosphate synthase subunit HisH [Gluconacetobacter diazotrophicus]CAP54014.1 putative imidazole glycerol phosphate synthase subunit hisH [Gluconacetobacter diazotrophicus PA1 5]